jgi:hypothetical protein
VADFVSGAEDDGLNSKVSERFLSSHNLTAAEAEGAGESGANVPNSEVLALEDEEIGHFDENGLELQIALDSMALGNLEPLKNHLARIEGLNPANA